VEQPSTSPSAAAEQAGGPIRLGPDPRGVLASQHLRRAIDHGVIDAGQYKIFPASVQPGSLDLHLGEVACRIRCSFLPDDSSVEVKLKDFIIDEVDLRRDGAVLETERPYLIPLVEALDLPDTIRGQRLVQMHVRQAPRLIHVGDYSPLGWLRHPRRARRREVEQVVPAEPAARSEEPRRIRRERSTVIDAATGKAG
jgi:hypothetical protein